MTPTQHIFNATHSSLTFLLFLGVLGVPVMALIEPWKVVFLVIGIVVTGFLKLLTRMFYYRTYQEQPKYGRLVKFFFWLYGILAVIQYIRLLAHLFS